MSDVYGHRRELKPCLGIGIEDDAAGIGIPASGISVRYRIIPVSDWGIPVFWYRTEYANFTQRLRLVSYNEIFIRLFSTDPH